MTDKRMGRPPKDPRGSARPYLVHLVPEDAEDIRRIGEGNRSEGIRLLLLHWEHHHPPE